MAYVLEHSSGSRPYPGSTKLVPIDVDEDEDEVRDLRCTVILRGKRIRQLLEEIERVKGECRDARNALARAEEGRNEDVAGLKEMVSAASHPYTTHQTDRTGIW